MLQVTERQVFSPNPKAQAVKEKQDPKVIDFHQKLELI